MPNRPAPPTIESHPWPLVLCLVGVDYFSTLAYLPSIAAEAAGVWAPFAAAGVVLVTFLLALPVYWYVVGRAPDGRGAAGMLEDMTPGWRGKLVVLTLLGFAAADFVITRSLSLADAAIHLIHNPHGQTLLARIPDQLFNHDHGLWSPLESWVRRLGQPQVATTLMLSVISFGLWQLLRRGVSRRMLCVTAAAVLCYLLVTALVIGSAIVYLAQHAAIWQAWLDSTIMSPLSGTTSDSVGNAATTMTVSPSWLWTAIRIALWSFPQMALGLTGFEMIMNVVPRVRGNRDDDAGSSARQAARIRNTRKLMVTAAAVMAVYLLSAVTVTTLLVPRSELLPNGTAAHRALAYIAHGSPVAGEGSDAINAVLGHTFGDLYDLSSVFILCLAGVSVTLGLQTLLPHYLNRLGMDVHWAGQSGVILHILNVIIVLVTVVFHASPSLQQWAYATSVLVLLAGAAIAAAKDLRRKSARGFVGTLCLLISACAASFFYAMTCLTVFTNYSGLTIALSFVAAIVITSFVSRWIRCTELRFEGFEFADEQSECRWNALCHSGRKVLVPHRPGLVSLADKCAALEREYRLDPATPTVFIEVSLGDPSNFYQKPLVQIERESGLEVIRLTKCVSIAHVLAAVCLELCDGDQCPPEIIFGWSHESPLAANLNFLLLGEGNIPWMVKELIRKAIPPDAPQPKVRIG